MLGCGDAAGPWPARSPHWPVHLEASAPHPDVVWRGSLARAHARFSSGEGRVLFLGGSITHMRGWRGLISDSLERRHPDTTFTFVDAGLDSMGSVAHAHRLAGVLEGGVPDLMFVEAAVNDTGNGKSPTQATRAMEGVLLQARRANPDLDIVMIHMADVALFEAYIGGEQPPIIAAHEVAGAAQGVLSVDLARAVSRDIAAGRLDWSRDFHDVHAAPYGQRYYAQRVDAVLDRALTSSSGLPAQPRGPQAPAEAAAYDHGRLVAVDAAGDVRGGAVAPAWQPADGHPGRAGFVGVPVLELTGAGAGLTLPFEGSGVGLWVNAGPDAAPIRWRVDAGAWSQADVWSPWGHALHLPRTLLLADGLSPGPHRLEVEVTTREAGQRGGEALRIVHFLVHGQGTPRALEP